MRLNGSSSHEPAWADLSVFSTCPDSAEKPGRQYLDRVRDVARWSERYGCRGTLIDCDNRLVDPWLVAQVVIQSTQKLAPLVAVHPAYMHAYSVANMIASLAELYGRKVCVNWVAGGFKKDLEALADPTPHHARYDRLIEYASVVRQLTRGGAVTHAGEYVDVRGLTLQPALDPALEPDFFLSGSSPTDRAAARALDALPVNYALPPEEASASIEEAGPVPGLRLGIIARYDRDVAWRTAYTRFPPDRSGLLMRQLARKVSDSHWHERLCRLADPGIEEDSPYWMGPFEHYRTMCPYLVGSHEEVAGVLAAYIQQGVRTFILDAPEREEDLREARLAFEIATNTAAEASAMERGAEAAMSFAAKPGAMGSGDEAVARR